MARNSTRNELAAWAERHPYLAWGGGLVAVYAVTRMLFGEKTPTRTWIATPGSVHPRGPEYVAERMPVFGRGQACDFVRYARGLLAPLGLTGRPADLFTAHVGRESGFGQSAYNYNFGNVRAFATTDAAWYRNPHDGLPYRSYESAADGMAKMLAVVSQSTNARRQVAWRKLQAGDRTWYGDLGLSGYYQTHDATGRVVDVTAANVAGSQADYDRVLATVERCA